MTENIDADNQPLEGTVMTPRQVGILKVIVIVMGLLLVIGFTVMIIALVYQAAQLGKGKTDHPAIVKSKANARTSDIDLSVPQGSKVKAMSLNGTHLVLHLENQKGDEITILDLQTGKVIRRIRLKPQ